MQHFFRTALEYDTLLVLNCTRLLTFLLALPITQNKRNDATVETQGLLTFKLNSRSKWSVDDNTVMHNKAALLTLRIAASFATDMPTFLKLLTLPTA